MNKISIALCTLNGSRYLEAQLNSFVFQERQPDEIIICDDRSIDHTVDIIEEFSRKAPFNVKCIINDNNLGVRKNFEKAIGLCSGDLVALSDQDDVWSPKKIKQCEEIFENKPNAGLVFTNADVVDESLNPLGYDMWRRSNFTPKDQLNIIKGKANAVLLRHYLITGATMIFRSDFKPVLLPIPDFWFHDAWIALLIASLSNIDFISEPMVKYRQHPDNQLGGIRKTLLKNIAWAFQINRKDYYTSELLKYRTALDRLSNIPDRFNCADDLLLKEKISHLQRRASMQRNRLLRIPTIVRELASGRYTQYSRNWGSVAMDLLFK